MILLSHVTCLTNEVSANMIQAEARYMVCIGGYLLCLLYYHYVEKAGLASQRMREHAESKQPELYQPWAKYRIEPSQAISAGPSTNSQLTRIMGKEMVVVLDHYILGWTGG